MYGQFRYLRDTFKQIDYLMSPTVGVGQKLIIAPRTLLAVVALLSRRAQRAINARHGFRFSQ